MGGVFLLLLLLHYCSSQSACTQTTFSWTDSLTGNNCTGNVGGPVANGTTVTVQTTTCITVSQTGQALAICSNGQLAVFGSVSCYKCCQQTSFSWTDSLTGNTCTATVSGGPYANGSGPPTLQTPSCSANVTQTGSVVATCANGQLAVLASGSCYKCCQQTSFSWTDSLTGNTCTATVSGGPYANGASTPVLQTLPCGNASQTGQAQPVCNNGVLSLSTIPSCTSCPTTTTTTTTTSTTLSTSSAAATTTASPGSGNWNAFYTYSGVGCTGSAVSMSLSQNNCPTIGQGACTQYGAFYSRLDCVASMPSVSSSQAQLLSYPNSSCLGSAGVIYAGDLNVCIQTGANSSWIFSCLGSTVTLNSYLSSGNCGSTVTSISSGPTCAIPSGQSGWATGYCPSATTTSAAGGTTTTTLTTATGGTTTTTAAGGTTATTTAATTSAPLFQVTLTYPTSSCSGQPYSVALTAPSSSCTPATCAQILGSSASGVTLCQTSSYTIDPTWNGVVAYGVTNNCTGTLTSTTAIAPVQNTCVTLSSNSSIMVGQCGSTMVFNSYVTGNCSGTLTAASVSTSSCLVGQGPGLSNQYFCGTQLTTVATTSTTAAGGTTTTTAAGGTTTTATGGTTTTTAAGGTTTTTAAGGTATTTATGGTTTTTAAGGTAPPGNFIVVFVFPTTITAQQAQSVLQILSNLTGVPVSFMVIISSGAKRDVSFSVQISGQNAGLAASTISSTVTSNPSYFQQYDSSLPQVKSVSVSQPAASSPPVGLIVGIAVGGVAAVALIVLAVVLLVRWKKQRREGNSEEIDLSAAARFLQTLIMGPILPCPRGRRIGPGFQPNLMEVPFQSGTDSSSTQDKLPKFYSLTH